MSATSPVVKSEHLAVGHGGQAVLSEMNLTIVEGETLGVVGRSGTGKTTLLQTLAGITNPISGKANVLGTDLPQRPPGGDVGYIPQSLGLVPHMTVLRSVLLGTLPRLGTLDSLLGRFPASAESDAAEAIEMVELDGTDDRRVKSLSGGQQRRVAIARALVQRPRLLLADEMLSELDMATAQSIIDCLERLQAETEMSVVIVEHDLSVLQSLADRLLVIEDGTLVAWEDATTLEVSGDD